MKSPIFFVCILVLTGLACRAADKTNSGGGPIRSIGAISAQPIPGSISVDPNVVANAPISKLLPLVYTTTGEGRDITRLDNLHESVGGGVFPTVERSVGGRYAQSVAVDRFGRIYTFAFPLDRPSSGVLVRVDDMQGRNRKTLIIENMITAATSRFATVFGLFVDAADRIYVADTTNDRIFRIEDMSGKGFVALTNKPGLAGEWNGGSWGPNAFYRPMGIAVDPKGQIYVADGGNNRIVRIEDMSGKGWTTFCGEPGQDDYPRDASLTPVRTVGRYIDFPTGVALDTQGRIYIASGFAGDVGGMLISPRRPDYTNQMRVIRVDDMQGTGWTTFGSVGVTWGAQGVAPHHYSRDGRFKFGSPWGIAVDREGRIYVADTFNFRVVRFNDMTGAGWTALRVGAGEDPYGVAVFPSALVSPAPPGTRRSP